VERYAVHLTWTYNGAAGKRARLRDMGLWHDPPEYYAGPSFVTVDLDLPEVKVLCVGWLLFAAAARVVFFVLAGLLPSSVP
jgi:elongation factor P hydroxylase